MIHKAKIINEGNSFRGSVLIEGKKISKIFKDDVPESVMKSAEVIDAEDKWLLPGVIDSHVHFREPGLTQKGDFQSESRAAVAGGVTSIMDMPNCLPPTTSMAEVDKKIELAKQKCLTNFAFYLGATNDNVEESTGANILKPMFLPMKFARILPSVVTFQILRWLVSQVSFSE